MIEILKHSGIAGLLALVFTFGLTIVIILVACLAKGRKPLAVLALVALLPLAFGVLGTAAGYAQVNSAAAEIDIGEATVEAGKREARGAMYVGWSGTIFLWCLCGAASLTKKEKAASSSAH